MAGIVWLASYPKSGNTWLRMFLHNYICQPSAPYDINALTDLSVSESAAPFYNKYDPRPAGQFTTQQVQMMRPKVHEDLTRLHDDLVFIKTHNAMLTFQNVALCTEAVTAGAIYIVRDPRDVAVSYARYTGKSLDEIIELMGHEGAANRGDDRQVFELLSSWSAHVASWISRPKTLVLRYEDMLADPSRPFGAVVRYLGDAPNPARLDKAIAFSDFKIAAAQEASLGYSANAAGAGSAFFRAGQSGGWQEVLTPAQQKRIARDHGAAMQKIGYLV
jgi:hypothetical protein